MKKDKKDSAEEPTFEVALNNLYGDLAILMAHIQSLKKDLGEAESEYHTIIKKLKKIEAEAKDLGFIQIKSELLH